VGLIDANQPKAISRDSKDKEWGVAQKREKSQPRGRSITITKKGRPTISKHRQMDSEKLTEKILHLKNRISGSPEEGDKQTCGKLLT